MSITASPLRPVRDEVDRIVDTVVRRGEIPGAVALVGSADAMAEPIVHGVRRLGGGPVTPETLFDLASLTKVVATLPAILRLAADGALDLDAPLKGPFPNAGWFRSPSLGARSARHLLTHTAGLPAWAPLMGLVSTRRTAIGHALASDLPHEPGQPVYSDLGYIVLGALVERMARTRQDRFVAERVYGPLGIGADELGYRPLEEATSDERAAAADVLGAASRPVAATEDCGWRGRVLEGEVHDEGAWIMEGVAGHAGLFGTAAALGRYAQAWLREDPALADPELLREATRRATPARTPARGLGWVLAADGKEDRDPEEQSAIEWRGPRGYGHTGFTGTSLWIDPESDRFCVLLTNRVHPTRHGGHAIAGLRRDVRRAVFPTDGAGA